MSGVIRKVTCPDSSLCFPESSLPAVNTLNCASCGGCQPAQFFIMTETPPSSSKGTGGGGQGRGVGNQRSQNLGGEKKTRQFSGLLGIVFVAEKGNIFGGQVTTLLGRE